MGPIQNQFNNALLGVSIAKRSSDFLKKATKEKDDTIQNKRTQEQNSKQNYWDQINTGAWPQITKTNLMNVEMNSRRKIAEGIRIKEKTDQKLDLKTDEAAKNKIAEGIRIKGGN